MRQLLISLALGALASAGAVGCCSSCDVCHSVGGPCGYYSLAGRPLPPQMLPAESNGSKPGASVDPYPVPPEMPTGPTAPDIQ